MKFRHILLLSLTLISASAQKPTPLSFTTKITPEMIQTLEARGGQTPTANPSRIAPPSKAPLTPEQQRTKMLQGLKIDRTTSGILANRLAEKNEEGKTTTIIPNPPKDPEAKPSANPQIEKQREDKANSLPSKTTSTNLPATSPWDDGSKSKNTSQAFLPAMPPWPSVKWSPNSTRQSPSDRAKNLPA